MCWLDIDSMRVVSEEKHTEQLTQLERLLNDAKREHAKAG